MDFDLTAFSPAAAADAAAEPTAADQATAEAGAPANSAALIARAYALGILHPAVWPPRVAELQQPDERSDDPA